MATLTVIYRFTINKDKTYTFTFDGIYFINQMGTFKLSENEIITILRNLMTDSNGFNRTELPVPNENGGLLTVNYTIHDENGIYRFVFVGAKVKINGMEEVLNSDYDKNYDKKFGKIINKVNAILQAEQAERELAAQAARESAAQAARLVQEQAERAGRESAAQEAARLAQEQEAARLAQEQEAARLVQEQAERERESARLAREQEAARLAREQEAARLAQAERLARVREQDAQSAREQDAQSARVREQDAQSARVQAERERQLARLAQEQTDRFKKNNSTAKGPAWLNFMPNINIQPSHTVPNSKFSIAFSGDDSPYKGGKKRRKTVKPKRRNRKNKSRRK